MCHRGHLFLSACVSLAPSGRLQSALHTYHNPLARPVLWSTRRVSLPVSWGLWEEGEKPRPEATPACGMRNHGGCLRGANRYQGPRASTVSSMLFLLQGPGVVCASLRKGQELGLECHDGQGTAFPASLLPHLLGPTCCVPSLHSQPFPAILKPHLELLGTLPAAQ